MFTLTLTPMLALEPRQNVARSAHVGRAEGVKKNNRQSEKTASYGLQCYEDNGRNCALLPHKHACKYALPSNMYLVSPPRKIQTANRVYIHSLTG